MPVGVTQPARYRAGPRLHRSPTTERQGNPAAGTPLPTQLTIVPTLNSTQIIQQEEIKSVIQEYFDIHYRALSVSPPADFQETGFGDLVSDRPDAKDFLETEMAKLAVERKHLELKKYRYTEYEYSLDYLDIAVVIHMNNINGKNTLNRLIPTSRN